MRAGSMFLVGGALVVAVIGGCTRDRDRTDRTTTTSGNAPYVDTTNRNENANRTDTTRNDTTVAGERSDRSGATTMRFDSEVQRLATARCDRELRCNNIGVDAKFKSRDHCLSSVKNSYSDELNQWDCKGGIDTADFDKCLSAIRSEDCGNPIDTVGRVVACRTSDLCKSK